MSEKKLYACLPFVEFTRKEGITLGPIQFWPSSHAKDYLGENNSALFLKYLQSINKDFSTRPIVCISIDKKVAKESRESLLIDGIYLLYFASNFRNVYYSNEILKLGSFTKILPATEDVIQSNQFANVSDLSREKISCINWIDDEISQALGTALNSVYHTKLAFFDESIRLVRSIRFFVDRFFSKFENLLDFGLELPPNLFEPEDILFLASSYDVLLTINDQHAASDFRQKIRPILQLRFSTPVELFWKWVDAFYSLKKQVVKGIPKPDDLFLANPNFKLPLMHIGLKLFIYVLYYKLHEFRFLHAEKKDPYFPTDFQLIHPQEILLYFWTEESLLRKISILLMQLQQGKLSAENQSDVRLLTSLYVALMEKFYAKQIPSFVAYIPTEDGVLDPYITPILNYGLVSDGFLHPEFINWLKRRSGII